MARTSTARATSTAQASVEVYLEQGARRTFALAVDWPGWARSGRGDNEALEALARYLPRYAIVVESIPDLLDPAPPGPVHFAVVERVQGNATTDFGAPGVVPDLDATGWDGRSANRHAVLVEACWARLDEVAARAPTQLRKGPRGGGRDRDAIVAHVRDTEAAYARKIGVKPSGHGDDAVPEVRQRLLQALRDGGAGEPAGPGTPAKRWPAPYAARRIAWHTLDHAWEIEDRTEPPQ